MAALPVLTVSDSLATGESSAVVQQESVLPWMAKVMLEIAP
jgi:purine-nucleoside phosphorylase